MKLMCRRSEGDKVKIPIKTLFERGLKSENVVSSVEGSVDGRLNILYDFGEKVLVVKDSTSRKLATLDLVVEGAAAVGAVFSSL